MYAHSTPDPSRADWEPLSRHLHEVADLSGRFAQPFGWAAAARTAGLLHDIGKASAEFQAYIGAGGDERVGGRGSVDHSTAGAPEAARLYGPVGRMLAFAIAGHHGGLPDPEHLDRRLNPAETPIPDYRGWEQHAGEPPSSVEDVARSLKAGSPPGFSRAFLTRMLFSCLVDADFLATEAFYAQSRGGPPPVRGLHLSIAELVDRLREHLKGKRRSDTPLNQLRSRVLDHATSKAALPPGPFTLSVPTGGGKTLTSLSFALEHARLHGLRRVIYVIPFTSIIEQTADVFRHALNTNADIVEHHANFDWRDGLSDRSSTAAEADTGEGADGLAKLRRAAENWDAPVVVTTAVQFFESLYANRTSRCRKLHNLAEAVVVLDEAQTLPLDLLLPCLAAVDELTRNYRTSVVLCTATQPAVRLQDRKLRSEKPNGDRVHHGLDIPDDRELAPTPAHLYEQLKRVDVDVRDGRTDDAAIVSAFAAQPQMLCIVNSRKHARRLFDAAVEAGLEGVVHLSTLMCAVHRAETLATVRAALQAGRPVRVISTSLIEAGVDISFPEVWRARTGLDSIAQAAGRCNREDELAAQGRRGRVVVFTPADVGDKEPQALHAPKEATLAALRRHGADPLGLAAVGAYFGELYARKDIRDLDKPTIDVDGAPVRGVLAALSRSHGPSSRPTMRYPFRSIAEQFRLIEEVTVDVVVPYDDRARNALEQLAGLDKPLADLLRTLQRYTVGLPRDAHADWLRAGVVQPVSAALGARVMRLTDDGFRAHYRKLTGCDVINAAYRSAESNLIG